jgi:carbon storage regulator
MLVLSRKESERLVIDNRIVVHVMRVAGGRVKLGIEAPLEVPVHREELLHRLPGKPSGAVENKDPK